MWDLIVSVPDHCLSFYLTSLFMIFLKTVLERRSKFKSLYLRD